MLLCYQSLIYKECTWKKQKMDQKVQKCYFKRQISMIALPGLHVFSRCDSTRIFHGICKRKWLNIVKGNKECRNSLFDMIESMGCQTHGFSTNLRSMTLGMKRVAGRNLQNLLKFPQQKTRCINALNASTTEHFLEGMLQKQTKKSLRMINMVGAL